MYEIDANNNRTATETYAYDELSRLTSVTYKDGVTQTYCSVKLDFTLCSGGSP
jgi:YD repeat-containing protein